MRLTRRFPLAFIVQAALGMAVLAQPPGINFDRYHTPDEVSQILKDLASRYPQSARLVEFGKSAGGATLYALELATQASELGARATRPAILVTANLEGNHLVGTEAALDLAAKLLAGAESDARLKALLQTRTVYVIPLLNPDAAAGYFAKPQWERTTNGARLDDDLDTLVDEDGPDDLNQDGMITMMRVKDPEGEWLPDPDDARLLKKADPHKGESGVYKLYVEGIDNDSDESYNEDPPGGVALNRNFPHDFEEGNPQAGRWPVSQPETKALLDFMLARSNIALVLNFSSENTFLNLEQTARSRAAGERVTIPEWLAPLLGVEPNQEMDLKEATELVRSSGVFGPDVPESRVAQILGAGPAVTIDREDLPIFEAVQKDFKEALKAAQVDYPERKARGVGRGSFLAYCYFQYGVPAFSSDLWAVPEVKAPAGEGKEGKGEEKSEAKEAEAKPAAAPGPGAAAGPPAPAGRGAPPAPAKNHDLDALRWQDTALGGKGFVAWTPIQHPTLGQVEVGGFVPYLKSTPPPDRIQTVIEPQVDFYLKLMDRVASLAVKETHVKKVDDDLYLVTVYLSNPGWFPTSTSQGRRALTSWPITVRLKLSEGQTLFSGRPIESVAFLPGGGEARKVEWTVRGRKGSSLEITADSPKLGAVRTQVVLQEEEN
jgi:murein tripeptide amidase MpaA